MKKFLLMLFVLCSLSRMAYSTLSWSSPVTISDLSVNASDPHVVIDPSGNATAAWIENSTVVTSSLPLGGSWTTPTTISNIANTALSPRLGVDSSGNVYAIWVENNIIEYATLPFGGSWSSETAISGSGASTPSLAVDSSGNAVGVWIRSGNVESSTKPAVSGTWSLVSVLSSTTSNNPHVAISTFGTAIAVWHSVVSGADVIMSDILTVSTNTWAAPKNVFSGTSSLFHNYPKVDIDSSGNATIAWFRYNFLVDSTVYENVVVIGSTLSQGAAAWQIPTILSNPGLLNPANLIIKVKYDAYGDVVIAWTNSYDGLTFAVEFVQKIFGGSWPSFPQGIEPIVPGIYSFAFDLAMATGTGLLTTMNWDGTSVVSIQSQEGDTAAPESFGFVGLVSFSSGDDNGYPACAMELSGSTLNAVAIWINFNGSNNVINAVSGTDTLTAPPTGLSVVQNVNNFGVFSDYYNTITWTASTDPTVIQYFLFRNGVFFTEIPSTDPLQFVDHNQVNGGPVTYGISAFTSGSRMSEIVTVSL